MMFHAAYDLPISDPQAAALERIEDETLGGDAGNDSARDRVRALEADLAAGIRAGKIDAATMQAHYAALDDLATLRQAREARALDGMHAALDAPLRRSLVELVRARRGAHSLRPPGDEDADWTRERLDRLTEGLDLDADQQKRVAALLAKSDLPSAAALQARKDEASTRVDAMLRAFEGDGFEANKLDLRFGTGASPHDLIEREARFLGQLLPILKKDQREKLAVRRTAAVPSPRPSAPQ
jgi:hypothetical protein